MKIRQKRPLHLFDGYGVEMEYMIVDRDMLDVLPVSDKLLKSVAGEIANEVSRGPFAWSNELVLHVIEIKSDGPSINLLGLGRDFQAEVQEVNQKLEALNAKLMPGAMHPWMDPFTEMKIWPHEDNPIYDAYNRIFDCRGHGWANLQSTHLNLPFNGDSEFEQLCAALRILTPLLPALSAASPIADREIKPFLNYRMEVYRTNSSKIPFVTGRIIPERVFTRDAYYSSIFEPMYRDISSYDPDGILQDEWLNSRGIMARFDRGAIEIRVMDIQECPKADIAILQLFVAATKRMMDETWSSLDDQKNWSEEDLYDILMAVVKDGERAVISNREYLQLFGIDKAEMEAGDLWQFLYEQVKDSGDIDEESQHALKVIFRNGPLARRILNALPNDFQKQDLQRVYAQLCDALEAGEMFLSGS
ncbi:glutamate--cysteine ligase [Rhodohalobacter sp. SW132]|uniref:carboxylate-amine ligase n=1 Tax=Rhodohalobacter sp. SW132 TaxID=2293433 RepID=UPI000E2840A8|nr:glutamate-cysteine ligase family protein [Rhodohalobacter sp. SW132]REL33446.1 glutamate--cysteine ligase [Rhodohalobacter sp. SW132]